MGGNRLIPLRRGDERGGIVVEQILPPQQRTNVRSAAACVREVAETRLAEDAEKRTDRKQKSIGNSASTASAGARRRIDERFQVVLVGADRVLARRCG